MYVYIAGNTSKTLYIGVTNNLQRRILEHKNKANPGFTSKYNIHKLVYFEEIYGALPAIAREKALKGLLRRKKVALIESQNPEWNDLSADWE